MVKQSFLTKLNNVLGINEDTDSSKEFKPEETNKEKVIQNASKPKDQQTEYEQMKEKDGFRNVAKGGLSDISHEITN